MTRRLKVISDNEQRMEARWTGDVRFVSEHLVDPLRWRKPRRIFVNSMSDLFHERLTNEHIAAVFGVMAACPQHTFQCLTKRARRMRDWFAWADRHGDGYDLMRFGPSALLTCAWEASTGDVWGDDDDGRCNPVVMDLPNAETFGTLWPLPNVWLGVSVENQAAADERIPELLATPAAVRFLSCEPLLGEVDLHAIQIPDAERGLRFSALQRHHDDRFGGSDTIVDWVISGCESGPGARRCDVAWLRSLRDQCAAAGVPFWLKQAVTAFEDHGRKAVEPSMQAKRAVIAAGPGSKCKAGGVIELPYLDGAQHAAFPEVTP